jgi:hypothetical protein
MVIEELEVGCGLKSTGESFPEAGGSSSSETLLMTDLFVCFPGVTTHYGCIFTAR